MFSRSTRQRNNSLTQSQALTCFVLCLVLIPTICPGAGAIDQGSGQGQTEPSPPVAKTSKSALDLELAKFQKLLDDKTLSEAQFQELGALAAKNPVNARAHLLCGRGYDLLGLPDEAVQEYKLADQYGPQDPDGIAAMLNDVIGGGGGEAANTLLNSAINRFPDNPKILFLIGQRLKEKNHVREASQAFTRAYKTGVKVPGLPSAIGEMIVHSSPEQAIVLAKEDLAMSPDSVAALTLYSKALMGLGDYELALEPLHKLYEYAHGKEETTEMYLRALYWCADFRQALEPALYRVAQDSHDYVPELHSATTLDLVMAHVPADYAESTLQNFYAKVERATGTIPEPFHFFIGRIFFRQHKLAQAKPELLRYLDFDHQSAETLWMLGNIAENLDHNYALALKYYRLAHARLPYQPRMAADCLRLEERMADCNNDWAANLRDWLYSTFAWGKH